MLVAQCTFGFLGQINQAGTDLEASSKGLAFVVLEGTVNSTERGSIYTHSYLHKQVIKFFCSSVAGLFMVFL